MWRTLLTTKDRLAFHSKAVEGIEPKFTLKDDLLSITDPRKLFGSDFFSKSLDFMLQVKHLEEHIKRHAMGPVFITLNVEERAAATSGTYQLFLRDDNTVDLLEHYSMLDLNTVLLSSAYYVCHSSQGIDAENLLWSQELILNSCDDELKHYLMSCLSCYHENNMEVQQYL
jgi:hypothetical protein